MNSSQGQLSVTDAEGVISLVPHMLGFHPRESLVVLIMRDASLEATLRVDLPAPDIGLASSRRLARHLVDYMRAAPEANGACLVLYSEPAPRPGAGLPYQGFVDVVATQLQRSGYRIPDAWAVGSERWWSYFCSEAACCPAEGRPLESVALSEANLGMVVRGSSPLADLWDGTTSADWPGVEAVRSVVDAQEASGTGWRETIRGLERWCLALDQDPEDLLSRLRANPADTGALLAALHVQMVRDALPFAAGASTEGARSALVGQLRHAGSGAQLRDLGEFMLGNSDRAPHWTTLERLWTVGRGVLPAARGTDRCALLCILAWIEWAKGHSSGAHALITTCRTEDPDYRLASLLDAFLARGRLPRWATQRETAWTQGIEA
ncbi:DUF4192 domain-containing protein [Arthrobacter sp. JSM 101049]|uniref:DUF4192 domain-containing protein n=1 Tax=Arthrobacter sp. JSM 101049 TaxID=929097 RepID=UPI00356AD647